MATFFVGQRVRVIWSKAWPELSGQTGRIVACVCPTDDDDPDRQWEVTPDTRGTSHAICALDGKRHVFAPNSSQLEPIVPDGHRACDDDFKRDLDRLLERQGIAA